MATEYIDGSFGETKPINEAFEEFINAIDAGTAKAFHVGTPEQIDTVKEELSIRDELKTLKNRMGDIEANNSQIIAKPSLEEIEKFA